MFALARHRRRIIMHSLALFAAIVLIMSSWLPQGLLLCFHHDGDIHVSTEAHHDDDHKLSDVTECGNCCHHDHCVDVILDLPDVHPYAHVFVQAGVPTMTVLPWSTELQVHDENHSIEYRLYRERQRDLGPPNDSLVRTVRLLV